ncbi:MAG TPA: sulfatase [Opitutaceae bacterium]|nr:sulfatase [Opitutaceae bacterium]
MKIPRFRFLVLASLCIGGCMQICASEGLQLERISGAKPRNVVFILIDDHRYDAMGFLGHPFLQTPHIDSLAKNGVYLKNACVTTALCSPSRASILTGLYTHKHRVIDNNRNIAAGTRFFSEYLQSAGYQTAFIGKWHMGGESDGPRPGFGHWVSFRGQGTYLPTQSGLNVNGVRVPQKGYITDELTDYAVEWLKAQKPDTAPFCLYLSHKAVHANFTPAERHQGRYKNAVVSKPKTSANTAETREGKPRWVRDQRNSWHGMDFPYHSDLDIDDYYRQYCETLLAVDDSVGRVLQQLKDMGAYDDTLVIYMGDNGFMFGEHGLIDKRVAYEEAIRVPMVMQCPSLFSGGRVVEQVVANIDIAPTILEAAGLKMPTVMDGRSFLSLAQGKPTPWREYFLYVYYWEKNFPQTPTTFALRGDQFKYITYYGLWDADELYDLQADPEESRNLIFSPEHRGVARQMESKLYELMESEGGLSIPLNPPAGNFQNKRLLTREGEKAADFPKELVVPAPLNHRAQ